MHKGIFFIPLDDQNKQNDLLFDEIIDQTITSEKLGLSEAFFGEHITDKHEKISSSLSMVSALSRVTKKINLGTLTTNLNFFKPATIAAIISQVDNLVKGRLLLGVGSGANRSDVEAVDMLDKNNHKIMLETLEILQNIFYGSKNIDIKTENFNVSTSKSLNDDLGLGYFNKLYKERKNLEIVMPALNRDSYNVKLCAKNRWGIVISNFCSDDIIDNHIESYLKHSPLDKEKALKKIRLSKLIFATENKKDSEKFLKNDNSPYLKAVDIIFRKLKTFNRHGCFGKDIENSSQACEKIVFSGTPEMINKRMDYYKNKYGSLLSLIYVDVPKSSNDIYKNSLGLFAEYVK